MLHHLIAWLTKRAGRDDLPSLPVGQGGLQPGRLESRGSTVPYGRREFLPGSPQDVLDRSLASKVLQGWMQNQHQTLVPLTLRFDKLADGSARTLIRFAAVACLAGTDSSAARPATMIRWLRSIGADEHAIGEFTASLEQDHALNPLIRAIRTAGLGPQAYALAVMATDQRQPAGRSFVDYIAARLELPADAVRSVERRYRR